MTRSLPRLILLASALTASAYIRMTTSPGGVPLKRAAPQDVRFLVNEQTAPGLTNGDGRLIIGAGSDPLGALRSAASSWSGIEGAAVRFAPLEPAPLTEDGRDRQNVIVFTDTPAHRSLTGGPRGAVAVTVNTFIPSTGEIVDSDIVFNPEMTYSTSLAEGARDIESTAAHELGHTLGANHSGIIWATMFQASPPANNIHARLSPDEFAFARDVYPAGGAFGLVAGAISFPGGGPVRGALVAAVDRFTGVHFAALTGADGRYAMGGLAPGAYSLYVQPLTGPVTPADLRLTDALVDTNFSTTAAGTFHEPTTIAVAASGHQAQDITVTEGPPAVRISRIGIGVAGGTGDATFTPLGLVLPAGRPTDLILWGPGIDAGLTEDDVLFWGPGLSLRRGAIRVDPRLPSIEGHPPVRMTVDVADRSRRDLVTVIVARAIGAAAHTGALAIVPVPLFSTTGFVNSADYSAGAKAPDSWVDLYGARLAARLVIDGNLPTSIDGTRVTLTASDGIPRDARLHFVSPDRIQFLMPPDIADAAATLRVVTTEGAGSARIQAAPVAPGLFSANATGRGPAAATFLRVTAAGARTEDYTFTLDPPPNRVNAPVTLTAGDVYLSFYGTGFRRQARATCQIGGFDVPVLAAVSQGQFPGLDQAVVGPVPLALAGRANAEVAFIFDGVRANVVTVSFR